MRNPDKLKGKRTFFGERAAWLVDGKGNWFQQAEIYIIDLSLFDQSFDLLTFCIID